MAMPASTTAIAMVVASSGQWLRGGDFNNGNANVMAWATTLEMDSTMTVMMLTAIVMMDNGQVATTTVMIETAAATAGMVNNDQ